MIISHKYRFVFVHIHKTGGESLTAAIKPYLDSRDVVVTDHLAEATNAIARGERAPDRALVKHSSAEEIRALLGAEMWEEYLTFAIVRHPVARAQSFHAYMAGTRAFRYRPRRRIWFRTVRRREDPLDPLLWPGMRAFVESSEFSEFIRHPLALTDPAMLSQWSRVSDGKGNQLVDFVAHTETLSDHFAKLISCLGLPSGVQLPHINVSYPLGPPVANRADAEYLYNLFRDDFEHFGYRLEI